MENLKYAIIDDDDFAHDDILELMKIHTDFECVGQYYNVVEAKKGIKEVKPHFIFLDVEMPNLNGFQLLNFIDPDIYIVIVSSEIAYACQGFELRVYDFLDKPIKQEKLTKTVFRLSELLDNTNQKELTVSKTEDTIHTYLIVSKLRDKTLIKIQLRDICSIEKNGNDLQINTVKNGPFFRKDTINSIIHELPQSYFKIINRSTIVNISKAYWKDDKTIELPNGKNYKVTEIFK